MFRPLHALLTRHRRWSAAALLLEGLTALALWLAALSWLQGVGAAGKIAVGGALAWAASRAWTAGWAAWRAEVQLLGAAARLERAHPLLAGLSAAVERRGVARPAESPALLELLEESLAARLGPLSPRRSPRWRRAAIYAALALALGWPHLHAAGTVEGAADAQAGDLSVYYQYPAYTGREPVLLEHTSGAIHGPPGTTVEVRARLAQPVTRAALGAADAPLVVADLLDGGRRLRGKWTLGGSAGEWVLEVEEAEGGLARARYPLQVEADAAPLVTWPGAEPALRRGLDDPLHLAWEARDDFGVAAWWLEIGGAEAVGTRVWVRERREQKQGWIELTPRQLGLKIGDEARLEGVALDNDAVSGAKTGRSLPLTLVVSAAGAGGDRVARWARLQAIAVDLLAAHGGDPDALPRDRAALRAWGRGLARRYEPLQAWEVSVDPLEGEVLALMVERLTALASAAALGGQPGEEGQVPAAEVERVEALRADAVGALEDGALLLDRALRAAALAALQERAARLPALADALEAAADPPARASSQEKGEHALAEIEVFAQLLPEGGLGELVRERVALWRFAHAAGAPRPALATQLRELAAVVHEDADRTRAKEEELGAAIEDLLTQLRAMEARQRDTRLALEGALPPAEGSDAAWAHLEAASRALARVARERPANTPAATALMEHADRAVETALWKDSRRVEAELTEISKALMWERWGQRGRPDPALERLDAEVSALAAAQAEVRRQEARADAARGWAGRDHAPAANALREALGPLRATAAEVAMSLPIRPRGMEPALEQADHELGRAADALVAGRAGEGVGAEAAAERAVAEAREALERVLEQLAASAAGAGEGGGGEEDTGGAPPPFVFPEDEGYVSPEAYRRAILEALATPGPAEEEYWKKRYFEELARW